MTERELSLFGGHVYEGLSHHVQVAQTNIYWQGFVYIEGYVGQRPSMMEFAKRLTHRPIEQVVADLKGSFFCIVQYDTTCFHAFVDNSGMFAAYSSELGASRSYLKLVDFLDLGPENLNWTNVAEFVQTTNFYFGRSHFDDIRKIAYDEILEYTVSDVVNKAAGVEEVGKRDSGVNEHANVSRNKKSGDISQNDRGKDLSYRRLQKIVPSLSDKPPHETLIATFNGLATALENTQVSVDVTGGLDTRTLIAGLVAAGVEFETSLSGMDTHQDVILARKVSAAISKPLHVTPHCVDNLESELESTMESLDGLKALVLTQHRILQLQVARGSRGMQLSLRGVGGEVYRDFKWAQDFPFYLSRQVKFVRYDRMRVEVVRFPEKLLSDRFKTLSRKARDRRVTAYEHYRRKYNTQSYDMLDVHETLQNSHSRAMSVSSVDPVMTYCPLSEVYRLQHAYHCSRLLRFGSLFQKNFITRCHAGLAKVPTSYGATASTEMRHLVAGALILSVTNVKKLIRKLSQTYLGRSPFILKVANHDDGMKILRASSSCEQAIHTLKRYEVLAATVESQDIPDRFIERLMYTGWFIQRVEDRASRRGMHNVRSVDSRTHENDKATLATE